MVRHMRSSFCATENRMHPMRGLIVIIRRRGAGTSVHDVDTGKLRAKLREYGAYLP